MSRTLEELVERQARRWEVERRATIPRPRGPCVAISRMPGAGGGEVGRQVADWLDYGFFGREIVETIAREQGVAARLLEGLDEHVRSAIDRYVLDAFRSRPMRESEFVEHLVRVVATLGERGMAVILGRGAAHLLPADRALRVFVVAPEADRARRMARLLGVSEADARARLPELDAERAAFVRHHFGVDQDDPTHYDVVVNTGTLGVPGAAALVVESLRRRFPVDRTAGVAS